MLYELKQLVSGLLDAQQRLTQLGVSEGGLGSATSQRRHKGVRSHPS